MKTNGHFTAMEAYYVAHLFKNFVGKYSFYLGKPLVLFKMFSIENELLLRVKFPDKY